MKLKNILSIASLLIVNGTMAQHIDNDSLAYKFSNAVDGETLYKSVRTNSANALFGRLKGLYVTQSSSETNVLDDEANFNIRGISTFGNAKPLVLVDGIQRDIESITLAEIDKVEVLKDAIASAIYGVQGANGAVVITTKRGKEGFRASANYRASFDTAFRLPKFVNSSTYAQCINEALSLDGITTPRYSSRDINYFKNDTNRELYPNVDWQDMAYRDFGMTHQADIQLDGGTNKFRYYTSLNYANTKGILGNSDYSSKYNSQLNKVYLNLRVNLDAKISDNTSLKLNLLGRLKEQNRPGSLMKDVITRLYNTPSAAFPVLTGTGSWGSSNIYRYNPIADIVDKGTVKAIRRSLLADMTLTQNLNFITRGLYAEITVAYDNMANYNDSRTRNYSYEMVSPVFDENGNLFADRTPLGTSSELGWSSSLNNQEMASMLKAKVEYNRNFVNSTLDASLVYEQRSSVPDGRNSTRKNQSIMGLVNYQYDNKYEVNAVLNYSGTAVLANGSQFNVYPAIGLEWIASNEDFLKDNNMISYLKVKTSFGLSGSDLFGHDLDVQEFGVSGNGYWFGEGNTYFPGIKEGNLSISHLLAENSQKFDFGVEMSLFRKLYLSANYFHERRSDIIVSSSNVVSSVIGIITPSLCEGIVTNQGVELGLNYSDKIGKLGYNFSGNYTYAKNKIVNNNEGYQPESYLYKKGNSLNQYYGLVSDGFFNNDNEIKQAIKQGFSDVNPGDIRYVNQNGDDIINQQDMVRLGYSNLPEIYYGFNIGLSYDKFSLNANFQGVAHRTIYLNTKSVYSPLQNNTNISTWYINDNTRWTPETAASANLPRLTTESNPNNFQVNDIWLKNGDYLKLRDLELAYNVDKSLLKNIRMKFFIRGTNLFSIDHLGYSDPENFGVAYPTMRSYTAGFELKF